MSPEAQKLAARMSDISEAAYCAGWMDGLEFALWRVANAGGGKYGRTVLGVEDAGQLLRIAASAGGWITWVDDDGETLVPFDEWPDVRKLSLARRRKLRTAGGGNVAHRPHITMRG